MKTFFKNIFIWILNIIKKSFKWIFSDWKNFIIVFSVISAICLYFSYNSIREKYDNVIREKSDSITIYKNKFGEVYSQNKTYITDIKNLKESNKELYDEVKSLKDNPIVVTKYKTVTEYKEIHVKDTVTLQSEGIYRTNINYKDPYTLISGYSLINTNNMNGETHLDSIAFANNFTLNLIESKKGDLSFIVKSDNPHCKINSLNGVMLSPEDSKAIKKRYDKPWCIVVGVGPSFTIVDSKPKILPALQITFGRKIFSF